ncbi:DUF6968 family protein [Sorangium cellulosum]|uniref:DUF6968 family protein n=1 Tax=Sorangium cellulosum TaxID=56 RepID=UPI0012FFBC79|nr:hypothetical protein [Sorangium cellulosum]
MQDDTPLEPIAERRLSVVDEPGRMVTMTIGKPMQKPSGDWACPVDIKGLQRAVQDSACGVDAVQALQLAFEGARQPLKKLGFLSPGATETPERRDSLWPYRTSLDAPSKNGSSDR